MKLMKMRPAIIYVCELEAKHLTLELQQQFCEKKCKQEGIENIRIVKDDMEKKQLENILQNIDKYSYIIILSIDCLGFDGKIIQDNLYSIMKSSSSLIVLLPGFDYLEIKRTWSNLPATQKAMVNYTIVISELESDTWKELY